MIAAMAQWEREEISERVAASVPIRAKLGKQTGGAAPFGYQWKDNQLAIDENEAPIRKLLFDLFREHRRKKTVARLLNEMGHRTRKGGKFTDTTVDRLLRDPVAKGLRRANYTKSRGEKKHWDVKPEEEWVYTHVEPIVSEEIWHEVNTFLDAQRGKRKKTARKPAKHFFSGLTLCGCGGKMYVPSNVRKYTCRTCRKKIPIDDLEAIFEDQLQNFLLSESELTAYINDADDSLQKEKKLLVVLEKEKASVKKEMRKYFELYSSGHITAESFGEGHKPLETRLAALEAEIPQRQAAIDFLTIENLSTAHVMEETKDLSARWSSLSPQQKQQLIETITDSIVIDDEEVAINFHYLPFLKDGNKATQEQGFIAVSPQFTEFH